jgi:type VI secretion system ImpA family protein
MGRTLDPLLTDLDRLLAPISPESPCGEWLRYEGTHEQIRDARREDDVGLPQGVWQTELKQANWAAVEGLCAEALAQRSKDLQLAVWLLEAWIQLDGFAGAARGLELMHRLCATFWDQMYPQISDDLGARLAPLQWVNDKLSRRLRLLRLTHPAIEGVQAYTLADWDAILHNPVGDNAAREANMARFQQSVTITTYPWFAAMNESVLETLRQVRAFDDLIDDKAGKLSPGLIKFRTEATSVAELMETMLDATRSQLPAPPEPEPAPPVPLTLETMIANEAEDMSPSSGPSGYASNRIRTRAEAYSQLEEIAAFLHENDPHSPTPYLIWRAVSWGNLHFDELLPELIRDQGELSDIIKLLRLDPAGRA